MRHAGPLAMGDGRCGDTPSMDTRYETLPAIHIAVWKELSDATHDKSHTWRTPVLATVNGHTADARVVILREVDEPERRLRFYTDERAGKVAQIRAAPTGCLVMWSPVLRWQLRCHVRLTLDVSGLAATSRWASIRLTPAANDYLSNMPPGAPLQDTPDNASGSGGVSRAHFAVVSAEVYRLDWLELSPTGNRRAMFDDEGERWVQP
jgi:pyridoxamine 5'-phosphate oxidase